MIILSKKTSISLITLISLIVVSVLVFDKKLSQRFFQCSRRQSKEFNGCAISESIERGADVSARTERKQVLIFLYNSVVTKKTNDVYQALTRYGFINISSTFWNKGKIIVKLDVQNDIITHATLKS